MKQAIAIGVMFCGAAFGQSTPENKLELPRFSMHDYQFKAQPNRPMVLVTQRPAACAIPLLNVLRDQDKTVYKIQALKPSATEALPSKPAAGLPACSIASAK